MSLIGLDIGTTGARLSSLANRVKSSAGPAYMRDVPHPQWAEQNAERVWVLAWEALGEGVAGAQGDPPLAMALSVQGEAVIPVDDQGCGALRPAILGMDTRTGAENRWLADRFGAEALFRRTGMRLCIPSTLCPSFSGFSAMSPRCTSPRAGFSCTKIS